MNRTKKNSQKDSQKLEARLGASNVNSGLKFPVREMKEETDKIKQKMEELLRSDSQSLRARERHSSAYDMKREHQQTKQRWHDCIVRVKRSNEASIQEH